MFGSQGVSVSAASSNMYEASVTLTDTQVKALNATPIQIVASPGAGKYIEFISGSAIIETYGGAPYATNTSFVLMTDTATFRHAICSNILTSVVARTTHFTKDTGGSTSDTQIIANKALNVSVLTGNPTAGNSAIKVKILYRIVTI